MASENQKVLRLRNAYLMRRFLLIALGMSFLLPTTVNAESFWLILVGPQSMEKILMKDMEQCLEEGEKIQERWKANLKSRKAYACVTGK